MREKIAIIGMSGIFPGAKDIESFWKILLEEGETISEANERQFNGPPEHFSVEKKGVVDKCYSTWGGYLEEPAYSQNATFKAKPELEQLDQIYRWSLYVASEALQNAGYLENKDLLKRCGLLFGSLTMPTRETANRMSKMYARYFENKLKTITGDNFDWPLTTYQSDEKINFNNYPVSTASLVAKELGLGGEHYCLDAACASVHYAMRFASDMLIRGEADLMLAGAVSCADPLFVHEGFSIFTAYPEPGKKQAPLDKDSGGMISAEGAGIFVLKRLNDALKDGDEIHAVINSIGLSNDGKGKYLLSPLSAGQLRAFDRTYASTEIDKKDIKYIECHATGTALGDQTEVDSISSYFKGHVPKLGTVKTNIGHLLTASGIPSVLKVIKSMKHDKIPASLRIQHPVQSSDNSYQGESIILNEEKWNDDKKYAAINAFGFGGTNAHMILEDANNPVERTHQSRESSSRLQVLGMDAHFGACTGINEFNELVTSERNIGIPLPKERWKGMENDSSLLRELNIDHLKDAYGGYIEEFEMDLKRFKILPNEITKIEKQHTLMLKVADNALRNAGFDHVTKPSKKVAVIIAMDTDPAGHQYFGRWHLEWQLNQLAQSGQLKNADKKEQLLTELKSWMYSLDKVELSVSMHTSFIGNIMASRIASLWNFTGPVLTLTAGETGVAKAIKLANQLMNEGEADAAVVGAVDFAASLENIVQKGEDYFDGFMPGEGAGAIVLQPYDSSTTTENSLKLGTANQNVANFDFVEISGNESTAKGKAELQRIFDQKDPSCPISNVKSQIGHCGNAAGMASILRSFANLNKNNSENDGEERKALVSLFDGDEHFRMEVTSNISMQKKAKPNRMDELKHRLVLVTGESKEDLLTSLESLILQVKQTPLQQIANNAFESFNKGKSQNLIASIIAEDESSFTREVNGLKAFLSSANTKKEWQSPNGSYFTHEPLGTSKKIAIGYPGSATAYKGVGKELLSVFPHLNQYMKVQWSADLDEQFNNLLFDQHIPEEKLLNDNRALILAGEGIAAAYTDLLQNNFELKPEIAFGYSMGEASAMFCAQKVWDQQQLGQRFLESDLFLKDVAGEKHSLQKFLNTSSPVNDIWKSYVIIYDVGEVKKKLESYPDVYITFINTPKECQISGSPEACENFIQELGATNFATWDNTILHHEFIRNDFDKMVELHSMPIVNERQDINFYSSVKRDWLKQDTSEIANNAAELNCHPVDFPTMIEDLYEKGVGIFVETGPGNTLSRWISGILNDREFTTITLNRKGSSDWKQLLGQLGKMASHKVPVDLQPLYSSINSNKAELPVKVKMGGPSIDQTDAVNQIKNHFPVKSKKEAIWDENDLHEFAVGKIENVFGKEYAVIDDYKTRVRLPAPPYLLVSRVTKLEAKVHEFKPSYIQTEYDIPHNAWYSIDGQIPWAVLTESGQCDLLLISYLGIDFEAKGERLYRLLAAKFDFQNHMPEEGDTLRFDIHINGFSRSGATLLFFFSYDCFVGDNLIVKMTDGCAGFFTKDELEKGAGITLTKEQLAERQNAVKEDFVAPLLCSKNSFSKEDLLNMTLGNFKDSFGANFDQGSSNPSLKLPPQKIAMFDRVTNVDPKGGHWGLGVVTAEKDLKIDDWYFTCHFVDDQVLAGSLEAEGGSQMVQFYMLYLGLWKYTKNARFQPLQGVTQKVQCRKETPPMNEAITYRLEVKKIGMDPDPYVLGDVELIQHGVTIVLFENIGLALKEK